MLDTINEEEHPEKDSKEVGNIKGSEDYKNFIDFDRSKYHRDLKDFDLWDD